MVEKVAVAVTTAFIIGMAGQVVVNRTDIASMKSKVDAIYKVVVENK